MQNIRFGAQQVQPSKVVCIGRNYADHIAELNNEVPAQAVIFMKPNSAVTDVLRIHNGDEVHYEGEISLLVQGGQYAAVAFGLDLTKRRVQNQLKEKGLPWERAKAFDGAAVFSEFVALNVPLESLHLELWIDGKLAQAGGVPLMLNKPAALLPEIQSFATLEDGDVIMTGTPKGVGQVLPGQTYTGKIFSDAQLLVEATWIVQ